MVAIEGTLVGTFKGPLQTPQGAIPPAGRRFELKFAEIDSINTDGLATEVSYY